jgi:hypothetical protein
MKRALVLRIAGPFVFALASCAALIALGGARARVLFVLTLSVTALAAVADACLARTAGRRPMTSSASRRALVFAGLGPLFGAFTAWSVVFVMSGGLVDAYGIPLSYLFSLVVCAITGPTDGALAHVTPIRLRAPLVAVVGAAVAVGVISLLFVLLGSQGNEPFPLGRLTFALIVGAVAAGVSSLLSHDYRDESC